jgi:hypothetical protein
MFTLGASHLVSLVAAAVQSSAHIWQVYMLSTTPAFGRKGPVHNRRKDGARSDL